MTVEHDKTYSGRTIVRVIVLIGLLIGIGAFIIPNVDYGPKVSKAGWVLISIWTSVLVIGGLWVGRVQANYHCPKCGARLPMLPVEVSTKFQHRFWCETCDVVWTTDVYSADT
jgi:hypothetical protein